MTNTRQTKQSQIPLLPPPAHTQKPLENTASDQTPPPKKKKQTKQKKKKVYGNS